MSEHLMLTGENRMAKKHDIYFVELFTFATKWDFLERRSRFDT